MRAMIMGCAILALAQSARAEDAPLWMAGSWGVCGADMRVTESWTGAGDTLVGVNFTAGDGRARYEFLRIAPNAAGGLSYYAMPNGAAATEFPMVSLSGERVVFENPSHDFPQRILYWREGARLHARVEGDAGGGRIEGEEWTFERASAEAGCP